MAFEKDFELSILKSQLSQTQETSINDMVESQSQVAVLREKHEVKATLHLSEESTNNEVEILWRGLKTTRTLLTYLKSKAITMVIPHLGPTSFKENLLDDENLNILLDGGDNAYACELLKSVQLIEDVMEILVKKVIMAESETAIEKEKFVIRQEEMREKELQVETMLMKVEEMENFKDETNDILLEIGQKVEDLVGETIRQRERERENEEELCKVKQAFESLKIYVASLVNVRQTLVSSEKQYREMKKFFERLVEKKMKLEGEKEQKEVEVQKLKQENVRLTNLLDKKEAQLLAMNEQCKILALSGSNILKMGLWFAQDHFT